MHARDAAVVCECPQRVDADIPTKMNEGLLLRHLSAGLNVRDGREVASPAPVAECPQWVESGPSLGHLAFSGGMR